MATKSILKNITIKTRRDSRALISALENAEAKSSKLNNVVYSKQVTELKGKDIKKLFGEIQ